MPDLDTVIVMLWPVGVWMIVAGLLLMVATIIRQRRR